MRYENLLFHVDFDVVEKLERKVKEMVERGDNKYEAQRKVLNKYINRGRKKDDE